jgi:lipopolysaccharide transport system permease protein
VQSAARVLTAPKLTIRSAIHDALRLSEYGDLLSTLTRHRLSVRYKQSVLGGTWALLQPIAMMVVFTAVFGRLVRVPSDGIPYALFAYAGLLPWTFFSGAVSSATNSLVGHAQLVTKVYFPREILPLSYLIASVVDLLIGAIALIGLCLIYHISVSLTLLAAIPIVALLALFALSCGLILSSVQVRFRDVGMALPIALQLLMFGSPVLYPLHLVPGRWRPWYLLNPAAGLIDGFRRAVLGLPPDVHALATAAAVSIAAFPLAYLVFKRADATIADVI